MIHGICPGVKCPEGRENKCSLCPYLITGKLFMDGVVHKINQAFAEFQRESIEMNDEEARGYKNHAKAEYLETKFEEILGWKEILRKINIQINGDEEECSEDQCLIEAKEKTKDIFGSEKMATELAYLHHAYDAQLMGVEKDQLGMKVLTIKAMKLAVSLNDVGSFGEISSDENKAIDMLMNFYKKEGTLENNANKFIDSVLSLPKPK